MHNSVHADTQAVDFRISKQITNSCWMLSNSLFVVLFCAKNIHIKLKVMRVDGGISILCSHIYLPYFSICLPIRLNETMLPVLAHLQDPQLFGLRNPSLNSTFESTPDGLPSKVLNGNGPSGSRLDNSVIFGVQPQENKPAHRSIFRTSSLPETSLVGAREPELVSGTDPVGTRYDRFSFLLNSSASSLPGEDDGKMRMSRSLGASITSPASGSPTRMLSPTSSIDLQHRPSFSTSDSPLGAGLGFGMGVGSPVLQKEVNGGSHHIGLFNSVTSPTKEPEIEKNLVLKYRAFPDAYVSILALFLCFSTIRMHKT